jgi:hypothetical protein
MLALLAAPGARAKTVEVNDPHGGLLMWYQWMWSKLGAEKVNVRIVGQCVSACTVLLGYIPRENICATSNASLGFHLATMQFATDDLWKAYPADIRAWITQHGGLTYNLLWLQGPALYKLIHKCGPENAAAPAPAQH